MVVNNENRDKDYYKIIGREVIDLYKEHGLSFIEAIRVTDWVSDNVEELLPEEEND